MIPNPAAASHLAELDARLEGHLGSVRHRAVELRERLGAQSAALRAQLTPSAPAPGAVLDAPLLVLNDDGPLQPDA